MQVLEPYKSRMRGHDVDTNSGEKAELSLSGAGWVGIIHLSHDYATFLLRHCYELLALCTR